MPATAAAGPVLGLPNNVLSIISLCQTVHFARNYEGDFALSSARLEMAGLRLMQWRQSVQSVQLGTKQPLRTNRVPSETAMFK